MASRRALLHKALTAAERRASSTCVRSASAMIQMEKGSSHSPVALSMQSLNFQHNLKAMPLSQPNLLKEDYFPGSDLDSLGTGYVFTCPIEEEEETTQGAAKDTLSTTMRNGIPSMTSINHIHITPPFHVLDGSGDMLASLCVAVRRESGSSSNLSSSTSKQQWRAPGVWLQCHNLLNQ